MRIIQLGSKKGNDNTLHKSRSYKKVLMMLVIFCFIFNGFAKPEPIHVAAANTLSIVVNYFDEVAYIGAGTGSSIRYYMSTDNKKTWELIDASGQVDISTILAAKPVTVYFRGNKDLTASEYTLDGEDNTTLKVTYEVLAGVGRISYTPTTSIVEYRKGDNGAWKPATNNMVTGVYEIRGATLYFRIPATVTKRASKIVAVKIPKRPSSPSVKVDGSKLYITGLKSGETQYRVGDATGWTTFTTGDSKIKYLNLSALLSTTVTNVPIPAVTIEFRTMGADKKLISGVKVIDVPLQPTCPDTITLTGTTLKITDTNLKRGYEYTRVEGGTLLNLSTAKWTGVSSKNAVIIPKAAVNDKIYVRAKSYTDSTTKQLVLASTYKEFTVTSITIK